MTRRPKHQALGLLRIELENLEKRGFGGLFCFGTAAGRPSDTCEDCPLLALVPPEHRQAPMPCLQIPLNDGGETIEAILAGRGKSAVEEELRDWMEQTAKRLERDLGEENPRQP